MRFWEFLSVTIGHQRIINVKETNLIPMALVSLVKSANDISLTLDNIFFVKTNFLLFFYTALPNNFIIIYKHFIILYILMFFLFFFLSSRSQNLFHISKTDFVCRIKKYIYLKHAMTYCNIVFLFYLIL